MFILSVVSHTKYVCGYVHNVCPVVLLTKLHVQAYQSFISITNVFNIRGLTVVKDIPH